jgi:serine/threonine kinase 3
MEFDDPFLRNNYYKENYNQMDKLGSGSFGTVFKAVHKLSDSELAFKKIKFKMENINEILTEFINYSIVKDLNQDFVVTHYFSWFERSVDNNDGKLIFFIGMELCDKTLDEIIVELHNKLLSNEILNPVGFYLASLLFVELVEGVNYLHNHNPVLIHRDLKPANILLKIDSNKQRFVKISDFGLLALHEVSEQSHTIDVGTPKYTAPEVMNNKKYDEKADIYSLGVIMQKLFNIDVNE